MGCEEFKPQECLLSLASKAHLFVFSGTGFCLHEEAPHCSVSWERQDPLCLPPTCTLPFLDHLPTPSGNTQGLASLWVEGAAGKPQLSLSLSPGRRRKLLCPGDWAVPWRQACYCKQTAQVQVKPYPGRVRDESEKNKLK